MCRAYFLEETHTHARTHTYTQINVRGVLSGGDTHTHTHTHRLMCGAYFLEDGKDLLHYYIDEGSVIHPLYERYGATLQPLPQYITNCKRFLTFSSSVSLEVPTRGA
jgi:hypothetical protein